MENIKNKFIETYQNKNPMNEKLIEDIVKYYTKKFKLANEIKNIEYTKIYGNCYDPDKSTIMLNKKILEEYSSIYKMNNKKEEMYFNNCRMYYYILHEIIHAKQFNIIKNEYNEISRLLNLSFQRFLAVQEISMKNPNYINIYQEYHDDFIIEYNANVEGYIEALNFINSLDSIYNIDLGPLIVYLKQGYKNLLSYPLKNENKIFGIKNDNFIINELEEYKKIIYGFQINNKTFKKTRRIYKDGVIDYEKYFNKI